MTPTATIARTLPRILPPFREYSGFNMSFERDGGSMAGSIAEADLAVPGRARVIVRAGLRYWGWLLSHAEMSKISLV